MTRTIIDFLVALTIVTDVFVITVAALWVVGKTGAGRRRWSWFRDWLAPGALPLAWFIATVATLGSLFLSEVAHFVPCTLCWYQRIAMYPLAIILGVAALRRDATIWRYALPVTLVGLAVSIYHYQLEWFPEQTTIGCARDGGCTTRWIFRFGFISIPFMAGSAFTAIAVLLGIARSEPEVDHG